MQRATLILVPVLALVLGACGDSETSDATQPPATEPPATQPPATEPQPEAPPTGPAAVSADAQESDGQSIVVASVTLPVPGFVAVHADGDGGPGAIIGHSALLPAGTSTNVVVVLDETLEASTTLWPMAHIDMDANGEYLFVPPNEAVDVPGVTDEGSIAVVPIEVTVAAMEAAVLSVRDSDLGQILVDGDGYTLYLLIPDNQGRSTCYEGCAAAWPALVGDIEAGEDADEGLIGSTTRTDGALQVTYNGWPLYYFARDEAPGDTKGQGVNNVWYVVTPLGEAVP